MGINLLQVISHIECGSGIAALYARSFLHLISIKNQRDQNYLVKRIWLLESWAIGTFQHYIMMWWLFWTCLSGMCGSVKTSPRFVHLVSSSLISIFINITWNKSNIKKTIISIELITHVCHVLLLFLGNINI